PFEEKGLQVFSGRGEKFTETLERHVESIIADTSWQVPSGGVPPVDRTEVVDAHLEHTRLARPDPGRRGRFRVAIDTANGATTTVAPRLFRELGFDVEVIGDSPDGRNINL